MSSTNTKTPEKIQPLDFEKPVLSIQEKIEEMTALSQETGHDVSIQLTSLKNQADELKTSLYQNLSPAQKLQIARHPQRPNFLEFVSMISPDTWFELQGDRAGTDDRAIIGGVMELGGQPMMIVGTQKGRGIKENLKHNFGMANPEGYRKALRLFQHAEKFKMPIITLIDTPG
nr:hypothetical protein [Vampirovibrio sp.]